MCNPVAQVSLCTPVAERRPFGEGAVVSAGSVVMSDVAPYTIVAGNPWARRILKSIADLRSDYIH